MYQYGEGVIQDMSEAMKWYRKSAEQGHAAAQFQLGNVYSEGIGVTEDDVEAFKWYRLSAEQGHVVAQLQLGSMHYSGEGTVKDIVSAYAWISIAAASGDKNAIDTLALLSKAMTRDQIAEARELSAEIKKFPGFKIQ